MAGTSYDEYMEYYGGELEAAVVTAYSNKKRESLGLAKGPGFKNVDAVTLSNNTDALNPKINKYAGQESIDYDFFTGDQFSGIIVSDWAKENNSQYNKTLSEIIDGDNEKQPFIMFPTYKVSDYSNTLFNWRQQVNPFGIRGSFYFRIFFNFYTNYGLIGGQIPVNLKYPESEFKPLSINTALGYLSNLEKVYETGTDNTYNKLGDRRKALDKFIRGLAYVSNFSPWFFKEIGGFNNIKASYRTDDDFGEKSITIRCSEESIDMRLGTLFDLYKFACFDNINNKEIIPANLRKFEMSILFFNTPLKRYHTDFDSTVDYNSYPEKQLNILSHNDYENIMSFKMFTFQNCEFDVDSLNEFADSLSNENPFDLGKNSIKIKYERVYEHRVNEFEKLGFGANGILFDNEELVNKRREAIEEELRREYSVPKPIYRYDEYKLQNRTGIETENGIRPESRYNTLYFENKLSDLKDHKFVMDNLYGNFTNVRSKYYLDKLKYMKEGTIERGSIYGYDYGRTGTGIRRHNTRYLDKKLDNIKEGTLNRPRSVTILTDDLAEPNMYALSWNAEAIRNSNNMYAVEGIQTTKKTWLGRLAEASWQRTKKAFGF